MKYGTHTEPTDFGELGFQTMLETGDREKAREICALKLHAYEEHLRPEVSKNGSAMETLKKRARSLHEHLYRRPVPVNDAAMLARSVVARVLSVLVILAAVASFAGNIALFYLFGFGYLATVLLGVGTTALPLVVGHLAYEKLVARDKRLQAIVVVTAVGLCFVGLLRLNQARQTAIDKATAPQVAGSYVDGATTDPQGNDPAPSTGPSETQSRQMLGGALFLILVAADLMLGFLSGLLSRLRTDEDYRAWIELKNITERLAGLEENLAGLWASVEIAKADCMAG